MARLATVLFVLCLVCASQAWQRTQCGPADQVTQWGRSLNPNSVLQEYPRPRMARPLQTYQNLNGLWEFEPKSSDDQLPPFGRPLAQEILVPFPVESCLSGIGKTYKNLWYRLTFPPPFTSQQTLLHFGAVDWQTTVYVNGVKLGQHTGGYDPFSFDITSHLHNGQNELIVEVFDPSDDGFQPNGKQRISAITNPGGDTYTPSSGIWQTVWLENVAAEHIRKLDIITDTTSATITVFSQTQGLGAQIFISDGSKVVASAKAVTGTPIKITVPSPKLWSPSSPFLYDVSVTLSTGDSVKSYTGLREFKLQDVTVPVTPPTGPQNGVDRPGGDLPGYPVKLDTANPNLCWAMCNRTTGCQAWAYAVPNCDGFQSPMCWLKGSSGQTQQNHCRVSGSQGSPASTVKAPFLNGEKIFLAGWLDQSWWPDGIYTAPSDDALKFDLQAVKDFGFNVVRLHQKVNSERWYWYADTMGIALFQDMFQKYGGATSATVAPFMSDLNAMIEGKKSHPSIIQWTAFNEEDCWHVFDVKSVVDHIKKLDPSRLVDTDSGGGANNLYYADVNDIHTYPYPGNPMPSKTQYGMIGEFGGVGAFVKGKEWVVGKCSTYLHVPTPTDEANTYVSMAHTIYNQRNFTSACIYTQITDVELECDGFYNFDRTNKFNAEDMRKIVQANRMLVNQ